MASGAIAEIGGAMTSGSRESRRPHNPFPNLPAVPTPLLCYRDTTAAWHHGVQRHGGHYPCRNIKYRLTPIASALNTTGRLLGSRA